MSGTYTVRYAPEALDDLKEIYAYIAFVCGAPDTAEKLVKRIRDRVRSLDVLPSRYAAVDLGTVEKHGNAQSAGRPVRHILYGR